MGAGERSALLVNIEGERAAAIITALATRRLSVIQSRWEKLPSLVAHPEITLALVQPVRGAPPGSMKTLEHLLRHCRVIAMLRSGDGRLMDELHHTGAWVIHEDSAIKTILLMVDAILNQSSKAVTSSVAPSLR